MRSTAVQKFVISANGDTDLNIPFDDLEGATIYVDNPSTGGILTAFVTPDGATYLPARHKRTDAVINVGPGTDGVFQLEGKSTGMRLTVASISSGAVTIWLMTGSD